MLEVEIIINLVKIMKALIERSERHCHLSQHDAETLGISKEIASSCILKSLSVSGEYATHIKLVDNCGLTFRLLYPFRNVSQVEASATEFLSIGRSDVPVRHSGDIFGCPSLSLTLKDEILAEGCRNLLLRSSINGSSASIKVPAMISSPHLHSHTEYGSCYVEIGNVRMKVHVKHHRGLEQDVLHLDNDWYNALLTGSNINYAVIHHALGTRTLALSA